MLPDKGFPQNGIWGDIVCMGCFSILSAVRVDEPGTYGFTKVAELPQHAPLPEKNRSARKKEKRSSSAPHAKPDATR